MDRLELIQQKQVHCNKCHEIGNKKGMLMGPHGKWYHRECFKTVVFKPGNTIKKQSDSIQMVINRFKLERGII